MHPENWMGDLKDDIWNKKLNEIVIPGTHDSGTYCINKKSKFVSNYIIDCCKFAFLIWLIFTTHLYTKVKLRR